MNATTPDEAESFDATELGAMMREMRENLGHDLESVAEDLRIRLVYLESIESGRLSDLPGNAYVSGFLRAYSDYLGLDGEEIVRRFKMAGAEISSKTQLHLPSPVEEGRLPTAFILMVAAIIAAAAYGGWYFLSVEGKGTMETVAKLPKELSGLVDDAKNQNEVPTAGDTDPVTAQTAESSPQTQPEPSPTSTGPDGPAVAAETGEAPAELPADSSAEAAETQPAAPVSDTPDSETSPPSAETVAEAVEKPPVADDASTEAPETPAPQNTPAPTEEPASATTPTRAEPREESAEVEKLKAPAIKPPAVSATTPGTAPAQLPAVSEPQQTAAVPPAAVTPTPRPLEESSDVVRIVVRATADSYVAVRTSDNEPLFAQLMRAGDSYEVPSGADLLLETGNAGALQIVVGGKPAPSLGAVGETKRNIPLDADKLLRGLN